MVFQKNLLLLVFLMCFYKVATAQETEFLPEADLYLKLNSSVRLWAQASNTRDGGEPTHASIGPSLDFHLKPLVRLKAVAAFDLDDAKTRPLLLSMGYRYLTAPDLTSTDQNGSDRNLPCSSEARIADL